MHTEAHFLSNQVSSLCFHRFRNSFLLTLQNSFSLGEEKTKNIQLLLFSHNKLIKFNVTPNFVSNYSQLKALHLDGNCLTEVPETIGMLRNLVKLHLDNNRIRSENVVPITYFFRVIPRSIGQLQELRKLYLENNDLYELPEEIGLLGNLEVLRINDNRIQALPSSLSIR